MNPIFGIFNSAINAAGDYFKSKQEADQSNKQAILQTAEQLAKNQASENSNRQTVIYIVGAAILTFVLIIIVKKL